MLSIGSIYWWLVPVLLSFAYFSPFKSSHIKIAKVARCCARKEDQAAIRSGVMLTVFLVAHLAAVDWKKPVESLFLWAGGYSMLTIFSVRWTLGVRDSLREYHAYEKKA